MRSLPSSQSGRVTCTLSLTPRSNPECIQSPSPELLAFLPRRSDPVWVHVTKTLLTPLRRHCSGRLRRGAWRSSPAAAEPAAAARRTASHLGAPPPPPRSPRAPPACSRTHASRVCESLPRSLVLQQQWPILNEISVRLRIMQAVLAKQKHAMAACRSRLLTDQQESQSDGHRVHRLMHPD